MTIIEPVIEAYDACGFEAWPVGPNPDDGFLVLSGDLTSADVGTVMAVITASSHSSIIPDSEDDAHPGPAILVQRGRTLVDADRDSQVIPRDAVRPQHIRNLTITTISEKLIAHG